MMYDLLMPSELTAAIIDSPDLFSLLIILFLSIVGLALGLVLLEAARSLRKHSHWEEAPTASGYRKTGKSTH